MNKNCENVLLNLLKVMPCLQVQLYWSFELHQYGIRTTVLVHRRPNKLVGHDMSRSIRSSLLLFVFFLLLYVGSDFSLFIWLPQRVDVCIYHYSRRILRVLLKSFGVLPRLTCELSKVLAMCFPEFSRSVATALAVHCN